MFDMTDYPQKMDRWINHIKGDIIAVEAWVNLGLQLQLSAAEWSGGKSNEVHAAEIDYSAITRAACA